MIVVYTGPSLAASKARRLLPEAEYRPPIVRGDLQQLPKGTEIVGIIDGAFYSATAVGHKEILAVLEKGIKVYGSSSMGALRAAELAKFGMVGVGRIFECYKSGRLVSDDEVAVTYNPLTHEQIAEPLVNVRYQLKAAEDRGVLTGQERRDLIDLTAGLFYPERSYPNIVGRAVEKEILSREKAGELLEFIRERPMNLKAEDAELLLHKIKELVASN